MRAILLPLLLLMFASMLGITRLLGYIDFSGNPVGSDFYNSSGNEYYVNGSLIVGENSTVVTTESASVAMSAVVSSGIITLVVSSVALAVVSGIQVLGSGLNNVATMAIFKSVAFFGIWALFSVLALILFAEVPIFGYPLYFLLTLFYSVGVLDTIGFGVG